MKYSLNTTFDTLALDDRPKNVAATAHTLGIATTNPDGTKSLQDAQGNTNFGIGIGDYPVTTLDQARASRRSPTTASATTPTWCSGPPSSEGAVVYQHKSTAKQVLDPKVANDVTLTLEPIAGYSGDGLANGRKSAAKTGTEGIDGKTTNNSDAWMVGYTPSGQRSGVGRHRHAPADL